MTTPENPHRIVVLGAAGVVGRWVTHHLPRVADTVITADLVAEVDHVTDVRLPDAGLRAVVTTADVVVLAIPEEAAVRCLDWLSVAVPHHGVVLSTCSVQRPMFERSASLGMKQLLLGVNPMFSPTLPSAGRPVVVITRQPCPEADRLRERLEAGQMRVSVMDPDAHDSAMSYLQALPHAVVLGFLNALVKSPFDLETLLHIAPPPARTLIALASRILTASPETYWDIQRANAEAAQRRRELKDALAQLDAIVADGRQDDFRAALTTALERLGPYVPVGAEQCRMLFHHLQRSPSRTPAEAPETG